MCARYAKDARDAKHYKHLFERNPGTRVGLSLAAAAVYAARHGRFTSEDAGSTEWKAIYHRLARYGETLSAEEVLAEMKKEA